METEVVCGVESRSRSAAMTRSQVEAVVVVGATMPPTSVTTAGLAPTWRRPRHWCDRWWLAVMTLTLLSSTGRTLSTCLLFFSLHLVCLSCLLFVESFICPSLV